jgi:putative transposase
MVSARARRAKVRYTRHRGISARRPCALLAVSRSTLGYCSKIAAKDAPVRAAMRELSGQYPCFGYRRIQVFLERRGLPMSADRAY